MNGLVRQGGCFCGSVRYSVAGDPSHLCFCHCASCRRAAGAPVVPWGTFTDVQFAVTRGNLAVHHSSPGVSRGFCRNCGSSLTYAHEQRPGEIDLTLATLDDPEALRPACHIWVCDKLSWVVITDGLPQFETVSGT